MDSKATKDPDPSEEEISLLVALLRISALISRPMRGMVADPAGISSNELRLLMALSGEGEAAGHELAEMMGMHPMNVSRALAALHDMGLVEVTTDPANRRRKPFRLSPAGKAAYGAMEGNIASAAGQLLGSLSASERRSLGKLLGKVDRRITSWEPPEPLPHVPRA